MSTAYLPFTTGTISIANNSKVVTATGAAGLGNNCKPGDTLQIGQSRFVVGATGAISDAGFELFENFTGYFSNAGAWVAGAVSGVAYKLIKTSPGWGNVTDYNARLIEISEVLRGGEWLSSSTLTVGAGEKTLTIPSALRKQVTLGALVRLVLVNNVATWMVGTITEISANTMKVSVGAGEFAGSGSQTGWRINASGQRGATGGMWGAADTPQMAGIELGDATDTTVTRAAAGQMQVEGSRVYQRNNILGAVSQAGGVPTGAIIESGSNANGRYVRYADGTQICTGTMDEQTTDVAFAGLFLNGTPSTGTFPATFASAPTVAFNVTRSDGVGSTRITGASVISPSTTSPGGVRSLSNVATHKVAHIYVAVGRWY